MGIFSFFLINYLRLDDLVNGQRQNGELSFNSQIIKSSFLPRGMKGLRDGWTMGWLAGTEYGLAECAKVASILT